LTSRGRALNLTKEGIVVQFLPEAKDLWVSLNQDI
jgi:hypothetical protein